MNLLDTFLFMYEADTTKVQKGADAGDKATKQLKDSIDKTDKAAEKLGQNFIEMAKNGAKALAAVFALGAIKSLVNDTAAHTAAVAMQAREMGVAVNTMSAYQAAVVSLGGNADAAANSMSTLRDKFVEMSRFGAMVGPDAFMFRQLGLSAQDMADSIKDPTIALGKLAEKFETLSQTQQLYIGKKLGLDQGTIALLGQGRAAFDDLITKQKELNAVTQEQADLAMKYKLAQSELSLTFETVKREIVTELLPAFTWLVKGISSGIQWLREHKGVAIGLFAGIGAAIAVVLLPPLIAATAALWAFLAPIIAAAAPFIALGVVIGLVLDDIEKFRNGQKSLIGEMLERWPLIGQIAQQVAPVFKAAIDVMTSPIRALIALFKGGLPDALKVFKDAFDPIIAMFKDFLDIVGKIWDKFKESPSGAMSWVANKISGLFTGNVTAPPAAAKPEPTPERMERDSKTDPGKYIAAKLREFGWSDAQAAGIAGSVMQESGGSHNITNKTSGAYGLAQWLGSRVKDFEAWAGRKLEGSSLDDQIAFMNYELTKGKEKRAGDRIRAATSAADAAVLHRKYYERPGEAEAHDERRIAYANTIARGQQQLAATNTPLATQSSQSIAAAGATRSTQVNVTGPTTINTQATDAKAISESYGQHLTRTLNDALDYHDDGVVT